MSLSRRNFLKAMLVTGAATGCSTVIDQQTQPGLPVNLTLPTSNTRHPTAHLLNRATFGPRPGQIAEVATIGHEQWIDQQLDYKSIDDDNVNLRLRRYDTLRMNTRDLLAFNGSRNRSLVRDQLAVATLIRAVYSKRQLFEVMVGFWSDHFSMYHFKDHVGTYKTIDDREVIRPHALGTFAALLRASAHSPAMLYYLDNTENRTDQINENYAREIMELHTLGVDGGYTEQDIKEVAKCFTGWTVNGRGEFAFRPEDHVTGEKYVLGEVILSDDPKAEGNRVLDILANHPETARFVCTKLVRRFIADEPPTPIIDTAVMTWQQTHGDIRSIVRSILTHETFTTALPKLKRPFTLIASLLRVTNARYDGDMGLIRLLSDMGHRPFAWTMPDGYPDTAESWSGGMLHRWNIGIDAINGNLPGVSVDVEGLLQAANATEHTWLDVMGQLFLKRNLTAAEHTEFQRFYSLHNSKRHTLGLLAASPAFQWR